MTSTPKHIALAGALSVLALSGPSVAQTAGQPEAPQQTVKATYEAWQVACANENPDRCAIRQVGQTTEGNPVLEMRVQKVEGATTEDGQAVPAVLSIISPLGTLLPAGVNVSVDGAAPQAGRYRICLPQGCIVQAPISDQVLTLLKNGLVAKVSFVMFPNEEVTVDISLNGFTNAFGAL